MRVLGWLHGWVIAWQLTGCSCWTRTYDETLWCERCRRLLP